MRPLPATFALALTVLPTPRDGREPTRPAPNHRATAVKVTVLSTMLAGDPAGGIGEWGYAALVEVDGYRILFDTGARPETVLHNAMELGIDLSTVTDVILSHNHDDHTGGLLALRREMAKKNPAALGTVHVARGIFLSRTSADGRERNGLLPLRQEYEALGGRFVEHAGPVQLRPGVWLTGPVPRRHPERNWSGSLRLKTSSGDVEDTIPEDASLVIDTAEGLVLVSGCGHAGIVNTVEHAKRIVRDAPIHAAIGGFHLFRATDEQLAWTAEQLKAAGLGHFLGGHCTGIEAVFRIREIAGLRRQTAAVSAVGSTFTLGKGIGALALAG
jgi:7,8-dihydropterin-6-yl-methyl-4-(beta-D-ribofuranosyl)aminobenzene 5'-phosphate synthase